MSWMILAVADLNEKKIKQKEKAERERKGREVHSH